MGRGGWRPRQDTTAKPLPGNVGLARSRAHCQRRAGTPVNGGLSVQTGAFTVNLWVCGAVDRRVRPMNLTVNIEIKVDAAKCLAAIAVILTLI